MAELCVIARNVHHGAELRTEVFSPRKHNQAIRGRYEKLLDVVALARAGGTEDQLRDWLWQLLHACQVLPFRLEIDDSADRTRAVERLALVGLDASGAANAHAILETLASGYGPQGAVVDMVRLRRDLQPLVRVGRLVRNSVGWGLLDRLDASAALTVPRLVRRDGTELTIERADLAEQLREAIAACGATARLLAVTGEPSTGKSALALAVADALARDDEAVIRLNLRDLPGGDGVHADLAAVLAALKETPVAPCRALVVDGCEAVTEGRSRTLLLLVAAAREAGLGVVIVVRQDLLADVLVLLSVADCNRVEVGQLSEPELDGLALEIPALVPAIRNERSRQIVGRIGLAALLVQSLGADASDAALSEAMVMRRVWDGVIRRRDDPSTGSSPDDRAVATEGAARCILGLPIGSIPPGNTLERLRLDGVLARPPANTPWVDKLQFRDDAIRDLAVAFVLLKENFAPLEPTSPKWALRAARIAAQARLEETTDVGGELDTLQSIFDAVADTSGTRWSEIPTEALVTVRAPDVTLQAGAAWLGDNPARIQRLLRVLRQRHSAGSETLDPVVATPVLALLADIVGVLPHHGNVADDCAKAVLAWLRGLALRQPDDPCAPRRRYLELLLASTRHDDDAIEAISMLGPDLGDGTEFLRSLASTRPGRLRSALESIFGPYSLARSHPDLLIELSEAYYIEHPDRRGGFGGLREDGIRDLRHGHGVGHPFAAAYHGPFWQMLNSKPVKALEAIERIVEHALRVAGSYDGGPALEVDLSGLGRREFRGDLGSWGWYRGLGMGPHPCMSALMAVERFADHLVSIGLPPAKVLALLLGTARTTPTLALAVGFAARHREACDEFLLAFLREPIIWAAENARVVGETIGYRAGPHDDDQVAHRERRRWDFRELGVRLMADAILHDDRQRAGVLRQVAESNVVKARSLGDGTEQQARVWSSVLVADHYTKIDLGDQLAAQYEAPDWALADVAERMRSIERVDRVYELTCRYGKENYDPSALPADIEVARDIVTDPPGAHRPGDAVGLVALATVRAHANGAVRIKKADLRWAFEMLRGAADACDNDLQWYPFASDRSAATGVGLLLLPAFHESFRSRPLVTTAEICAVGGQLAANGSVEVRRMIGLGLDPVWSAPCGPGLPGSEECRHQLALDLAERSAQYCRLGPFDPSQGRGRLVDVPLPLSTELNHVPTTEVILDRLTGAIAASVACAVSDCCASDRGMHLARTLVRTHRRVAGHWADSNFEYREWDSEPVAAALLTLADHGDSALLDTALHLAEHPHGLVTLLEDICRLATYDPVQRSRMAAIWPTLFDEITSKLRQTGRREGNAADEWRFWGNYALAALIPVQQFNIVESDYDATLAASKEGWPTLDAIADSIDTWLELTAGIPKCVDALARLVWQETDMTVGLGWIEKLIDGHASQIANQTGSMHHWLEELAGTELSAESGATFDRIVDALATAGDDHVSRLQKD